MPGLLGFAMDALGISNTIQWSKNNIKFSNVQTNINAIYNGYKNDIANGVTLNGANVSAPDPNQADKFIPLGVNAADGWLAKEDVKIHDPIKGGDYVIKAGHIVTRNVGPQIKRNAFALFRNYESFAYQLNPYAGDLINGADPNSDGYQGDVFFNATDYATWTDLNPASPTYEKLRFSALNEGDAATGSAQNAYRLPPEMASVGSPHYAFFMGNGEWLVVNKAYRTTDGINPYGGNTLTGFPILGAAFNGNASPQWVQNNIYNYNPNNPQQIQTEFQNIANSYNTPISVTHLKAVDQAGLDANNGALANLKLWLSQKDAWGRPVNTYQNGILTGVANYPPKTIDITDANGVVTTKTVKNAYVNNQGELLVEWDA